jgi:uncharacterized sulfatase
MTNLITKAVCALLGVASANNAKRADKRPNILFMMSDDHALKAISAYDDVHIKTPNIDRIADEGMRFDNAFVTNSLCGPARAVVITSKYSHINGFVQNDNMTFDETQWTYPKEMQNNGYFTSIVGKYHLNSEPTHGGFDYWNILKGQGEYYQPDFIEMGKPIRYQDTHVTDKITDIVLDTLENKAPADKPWMMMMHHKAPHRNQAAPTRYLGHFDNTTFSLPDTYFDTYATRCPASAAAENKVKHQYWSNDLKLELGDKPDPGLGGGSQMYPPFDAKDAYASFLDRLNDAQRAKWNDFYKPISDQFYGKNLTGQALDIEVYQKFMRDYMQSVAAVDESIGKVLDYLNETGQIDNTLIVYTADQGFFLGEHGFFDKRFMYEPTLHTPLLMRYPPMIKAGSVQEKMALNLDYGATFLDLAGIAIPDAVQGESLLPLMNQTAGEEWRKSIYYHYYEYPGWHMVRKQFGVRTETHKLIHFYGDGYEEFEMFDLVNDADEMINLYNMPQYAEVQKSLFAELARL